MKTHSSFAPSSFHIFLNCQRAYLLTKDIPSTDTVFTLEGTKAHEYVEYLVRKEILHEEVKEPDHDREMEICGSDYLDFVKNKIMENIDSYIDTFVEEKISFSKFIEDGFGSCDLLIVTKNKLIICDYKYGKGVEVDAKDNPQLMLYALGALEFISINNINDVLDIKEVEMNIFQPRIDNYSTDTKSFDELMTFGKKAHDIAALCLKKDAPIKAGAWCKWCKVNPICKERAKNCLRTIERILSYGKN